MTACANCNRPYEFGPATLMCRACGFFNLSAGGVGGAVDKSKTLTLDQVQAASVEKIITNTCFDAPWGGGFVPSSASIIGGTPGAGKSSVLLQIGSRLAEVTKKRAYFFSAEMSAAEMKTMAERLAIPNLDRFRVLAAMGGGAEIDADLLKEDPPACIILDSISALCGRDLRAQLLVAKQYKRLAVAHKAPAFLVNHINKQNDYAGGMATLHEVDTLIGLDATPERRTLADLREKGYSAAEIDHYLNDMRVITPMKNRFGPMHVETVLLMTPRGLVALPPPRSEQVESRPADLAPIDARSVDDAEPEPPRTRGRRPKAPNEIKQGAQVLRLVPRRRDSDDDGGAA